MAWVAPVTFHSRTDYCHHATKSDFPLSVSHPRKLRQEQRELEDALKEMRRKQREAKKTELLAKAGKGAQGQGQKQKQGAGEGQGDEKDGEGEGDAKQGDEKQEEDGEVEDPVAEEKRKEARVRVERASLCG